MSVTSCVPGPSPPTGASSVNGGRVEAVEVRDGPTDERDRVVRREAVVEPDLVAGRDDPGVVTSRLPATGRIETVTVTLTSWPPAGWTPSGSARPTSWITSWVTPLIWTGSVGASARPRIASASPSTDTIWGLTAIPVTS